MAEYVLFALEWWRYCQLWSPGTRDEEAKAYIMGVNTGHLVRRVLPNAQMLASVGDGLVNYALSGPRALELFLGIQYSMHSEPIIAIASMWTMFEQDDTDAMMRFIE